MTLPEPPHSFLVVSDPGLNLLAAELAGRRQTSRTGVQSRGQEQEQFLFLLRRQRVGRCFDLSECVHAGEV